MNLSTEHVLVCGGTREIRKQISEKVGGGVEQALKDPSSLNKLKNYKRKETKSFISEKITHMIYTLGSRVTK